jgi:hypothetical protein
MSDVEHPVPPAGEEIHLPGPSMKPFMCAMGITLTVIGTTIFTPYVLIVGLIIFLTTTYKWIKDVRHDIAALPEEHGQQH